VSPGTLAANSTCTRRFSSYRWPLFLRKAALRPVPEHATVSEYAVDALEVELEACGEDLQEALDVGYRGLDRDQPSLADWLSEQVTLCHDEMVQSLGYFLVITVFMLFREAFPRRLTEVDEDALSMARNTLEVDEELRAHDPHEVLESDDVIGLTQPLVLDFIQHHIQEALEQTEGELDIEALDRLYRALLVEVIALSHAVASPSGVVGPPPDVLA